jgi:hypothetical protein
MIGGLRQGLITMAKNIWGVKPDIKVRLPGTFRAAQLVRDIMQV